ALVLAPTRELVTQIEAAMAPMAKVLGLSTLTIFGGVKPGGQISALRRGVDIVLACPGRLEDHLRSNHLDLGSVEITVLDEADHMADLGFLPGVRRIMDKTPREGQRLLFSATLDKAIDVLVKRFLTNPVTHQADSAQSPISTMHHHVLHLNRDQRVPVLVDLTSAPGRTVVFTRTKHGAKALARQLNKSGVPCVELHGNLSQNARTRNMEAFHAGKATTLVATDIAARGIHVDDVSLVVHVDPPADPKDYLHRAGRTARAGDDGIVVTLVTHPERREVETMTRKAGVKAISTTVRAGDTELARITGARTPSGTPVMVASPTPPQVSRGAGRRGGVGGSAASGRGRGSAQGGRRTGQRRT
ncbi:MAG: DEAD/DEAH box helicase, partial [Mycobacteriaceae bacterium]